MVTYNKYVMPDDVDTAREIKNLDRLGQMLVQTFIDAYKAGRRGAQHNDKPETENGKED